MKKNLWDQGKNKRFQNEKLQFVISFTVMLIAYNSTLLPLWCDLPGNSLKDWRSFTTI